ncbi:hypothetical protein HOY80DRAFT_1004891 [Tuber brumale]|nr:hypothetical protein HOY80DRAFT_1004891 [Tuber brumale]
MSWTQFFQGLNVSQTNLAETFEEENELKLQCVIGNVVIIRDRNLAVDHTRHAAMDTREYYRLGGILDIQDTNAINDHMDVITFGSLEGNVSNKVNSDGTPRIKGYIIGHRSFAPTMEK